jgi:hypothetical protein
MPSLRDLVIYEARRSGEPLRSIGSRWNISGERVRQITQSVDEHLREQIIRAAALRAEESRGSPAYRRQPRIATSFSLIVLENRWQPADPQVGREEIAPGVHRAPVVYYDSDDDPSLKAKPRRAT